jgi:hypothetical protein
VFELVALAFGSANLLYALEQSLLRPAANLLSDALSAALPSGFSPWWEALREDPINFLTLSLLLTVCILWGKLIDRRINDRSFATYNASWRERRVEWFKTSLEWRRITGLWSGVTCGALFLIALYLYATQPTCGDDPSGMCGFVNAITRFSRIVVGLVLLTFVGYSIFSIRMLPRLMEHSASREPRGLALLFSNKLRHSRPLVRSYRWVVWQVIPAFFAALVVLSPIALINRISFNFLTEIGRVCTSTNSDKDRSLTEGDAIILLDFSSVCQPAHLILLEGERYTISLVQDDQHDESDLNALSDEEKAWRSRVLQFPKNSPLPTYSAVMQIVALPFRRVLSERFFTVVAQVGVRRAEQYAVDETPTSDYSVTFTASSLDEPLFLYLNNGVVGLPGLLGAFYYQKGAIKVSVRHESGSR